jgi:hypothetical protein
MTSTASKARSLPPVPAHGRVGLRQLIVSEWTKFRSVRSTWISLGLIVIFGVGFGALFSWAFGHHWAHRPISDKLNFDPVTIALAGTLFGQLVAGVLGVLFITSEYSTGSIRTTVAAAPRRLSVGGAKAIVLAATIFVVGEITTFASFFVSHAVLVAVGGKPLPAGATLLQQAQSKVVPVVSISSPGVAMAVFRAGIFLMLASLLALGIGFLLRNTAGAISLYVGLFLALPLLLLALPSSITKPIEPRLPSNLGSAMSSTRAHSNNGGTVLMHPWPAALLLVFYVVVVLGFGLFSFIRRDA